MRGCGGTTSRACTCERRQSAVRTRQSIAQDQDRRVVPILSRPPQLRELRAKTGATQLRWPAPARCPLRALLPYELLHLSQPIPSRNASSSQTACPSYSHNLLILIHQLHLRLHLLDILQLLLQYLELVGDLVHAVVELGEGVDVGLVGEGDGDVGVGRVVLELSKARGQLALRNTCARSYLPCAS